MSGGSGEVSHSGANGWRLCGNDEVKFCVLIILPGGARLGREEAIEHVGLLDRHCGESRPTLQFCFILWNPLVCWSSRVHGGCKPLSTAAQEDASRGATGMHADKSFEQHSSARWSAGPGAATKWRAAHEPVLPDPKADECPPVRDAPRSWRALRKHLRPQARANALRLESLQIRNPRAPGLRALPHRSCRTFPIRAVAASTRSHLRANGLA